MTRVLIISHDVVGSHMAGPGIRYRELARVLSGEFRATLAVPNSADPGAAPFEVWPYHRGQWESLAAAAHQADVVVACGDTLAEFPALAALPVSLAVDGYDPHTLETLALWAEEPADVQIARHAARLDILRLQCEAGDFYICASERQRDWWLGALERHGRINPQTYAADPSLRDLVDVVPYGLPAAPPHAGRAVLRGTLRGLSGGDRLVLWGGGLWEWLDPLTAIRAMRRLALGNLTTGRIRLVFPGTRHPNRLVPDMPLRQRALALSDELGLTGDTVFFGDWVRYEDWPAVLLEADVGLSLHRNTVEARLAYRSRVMDYVWAGLPMVVTRGDAAADLVERYDLGRVVDYEDDAAVADGILCLLEQGKPKGRFDAARQALTWERAVEPLVRFCRHPHRAPDRPARFVPLRSARALSARTEKRPSVSVIVLTWNGAAFAEDCLTALEAQDYREFEVIVVDNGSSDGTPKLVAERFPRAKLISNERNLGFAAGNNIGLRASTGDLIVLLNQDTQVRPGWLEALASTFDDPTVAIAGCKLLYPDGTIQHAGGYLFGSRGDSDHWGRHALDDGRFDEAMDVEYVTGAALAIRRTVVDKIGLLDEAFGPAYYEDTDWCYRARAAGFRVVYQPRAIVTHHESVSTEASSYGQKQALNRGRVRFLFKHLALNELLQEFRAAEMAWLPTLDRNTDLMAAREAYLHTLLAWHSISKYRQCSAAEEDSLIALLTDLRRASIPALPGFTRKAEPEGPLIAGFRSFWNSISKIRYVRSLIQQQFAFTAAVTRHLQEQAHDAAQSSLESTLLAELIARSKAMPEPPSTAQLEMEDGAGR
jgi:GT2 family glycosyltransferase/glycosyltransferase involved in cell wall biosynthesis